MNSIAFLFIVACAVCLATSLISFRIRRQHLLFLIANKQNGLLQYDAERALGKELRRSIVLLYLLIIGIFAYYKIESIPNHYRLLPPELASLFVVLPFLVAGSSFDTLWEKKVRHLMTQKEVNKNKDEIKFFVEKVERLQEELSHFKKNQQDVFDFFLIIDGASGLIEARGPKGIYVPPVRFEFPNEVELEEVLNNIKNGYVPSYGDIEYLGGLLFDALFPPKILRAFERAHAGLPDNARLRVNLAVRTPKYSGLPWELLYDRDGKRFWGLRVSCPLVRFVESSIPLSTKFVLKKPTLRVLYVQASPVDMVPLDLKLSEKAIQESLGEAEIHVLRNATPRQLRNVLRENSDFDILHFDAHGTFDTDADSGLIFLHDTQGQTYPLGSERLATYLDGTKIQLVVLAACQTGVDSSQKRFMGIAQQLMHSSELPAVVAMQFDIPDDSAIAFNRGFYEALTDGYPIDMAIIEGRKAILEHLGGTREALASSDWAAPVLWMRSKLDKNGDFVEFSRDRSGYDEETYQKSISKTARRNFLGTSVLSPLLRGLALARSGLHRMVSPAENKKTT